MKKSGLGRGLDALLPDFDIDAEESAGNILSVSIYDIDQNTAQPRKHFDEGALNDLAQSIKENGILQPILTVKKDGRYFIVAGERRFRAARLAGLKEVPVIVRDLSEQEQMELALVENLQREDLNPMEEAAGIRSLMDRSGYTQEEAAKRLGKSRPAVANALRLLSLPPEVQQMVQKGMLSAGHARVICGVEGDSNKIALAKKCVSEGLSVRQAEAIAASGIKMTPARQVEKPRDLELKDFEEKILSLTGLKAAISGTQKKGKITLFYNSRDELESFYAFFSEE